MVFSGDVLWRLDIIFQKSMCYNHDKANYERSFLEGIIPRGLKRNKRLAFEPVSDNFPFQWNNVLFDAEKKLVKLLLEESEKVIEKIEIDISNWVKENYAGFTSQQLNKINGKHKHFKLKLEKKRNRKWEKFKSREKDRSNQITATVKTVRSFKPNSKKWIRF